MEVPLQPWLMTIIVANVLFLFTTTVLYRRGYRERQAPKRNLLPPGPRPWPVIGNLNRVVGRDRLVGDEDIPRLPYLDAVVKETMRLHPTAPLLTPRVSREHTTVAGYDVPAGTRVLVNVWAIARDPAVWGDNAGEFRPERFLAGSRHCKVDVKGQDLELLPFGAGRRMCPAHGLGFRTVQLLLANLVHGYAWRLPGGGLAPEELSMEEKFGISVSRMHQLQAIPEPRLPDDIYFSDRAP